MTFKMGWAGLKLAACSSGFGFPVQAQHAAVTGGEHHARVSISMCVLQRATWQAALSGKH